MKKRARKLEVKIYKTVIILFISIVFATGIFFVVRAKNANDNPRLANYLLGTLPTDEASINTLARFDLLILSPEQALTRRSVIDKIKKLNPSIILLAYVPAQSYNDDWEKYPANTLYKNFSLPQQCWFKSSAGKVLDNSWPGLFFTTIAPECTDYLVNFVRDNILSTGVWDGVFYDMVFDNISWLNNGDIDLNFDGVPDDKKWADAEWQARTVYLLKHSRELSIKYILINGSSVSDFQPLVNGRMYENFPTPWEAGGSWSGIMTGMTRNIAKNQGPKMYVVNANTNNTGKQNDYRAMRFGLGSSLMLDNVYFSFDYGDKDHNQVWWYDEYDVGLGVAGGQAQALSGGAQFNNDVWRRDYEHGVVIVNPTNQAQAVDLGGEFERINGTQDKTVNNGLIVDKVNLNAKDAIIMLKTFQIIDNAIFVNGGMIRFYSMNGLRARNGFFVFDDLVPGGALSWRGDLNNDNFNELVALFGSKLQIFNGVGAQWYNDYPLGLLGSKQINIAIGRPVFGANYNILLGAPSGGQVGLFNYLGQPIKNIFPLGKKFVGGFSVAIGDVDGDSNSENIIGVGAGKPAEVIIYDRALSKIKKRFYPYEKNFIGGVQLAVGDVNGDSKAEIITVPIKNKKPLVRIFTSAGKKISEFTLSATFGEKNFVLSARDVNYDGKDEVVIMSGQ